MPSPVYTLAVDLAGDELFDSTDVLTADVVSPGGESGERLFTSERGHDLARVLTQPRAGEGRFLLDNTGGEYSAGGTLVAGRAVRLRGVYSGTTYDLMRGILDRPRQLPVGGIRKLTEVRVLGSMSRLAGRKVSTAAYSSITTGVAIGYALDAADYPKNLAAYVLGLTPAGQWSMGETSGVASDTSGNANDGTVTIGAGSRDFAALDDDGDGCIDFDGAATLVSVADAAAIQNIFDGAGAIALLCNIDSDGEADTGRLLDKAAWYLNVQNEAGGLVRLNFRQGFSTTEGIWQGAVNLPISTTLHVIVVYNADAVTNDPTIYVWDNAAETFTTLTVGSGLTETSTPVGTRTTDVGSNLIIGNINNDVSPNAPLAGIIGPNIFFLSDNLTAAEETALLNFERPT